MRRPRGIRRGGGKALAAAAGSGSAELALPEGPTGGMRVLFRNERVNLALLSVGAAVQVGGQLGIPLAFGAAVNDMTNGDEGRLLLYTALIVVLGVVMAAGTGISTFASSRLGLEVEMRLRDRLFRHLTRLDVGLVRRLGVGDLITRLIFSTQAINPGVIQTLPLAIKELLYFVVAGAIMIFLSPLLAVLSLWPLPLIAYFSWRYNNRARPIMLAVQETTGELTAELDDVLESEATAQAFNRQAAVSSRIGERIQKVFGREKGLRRVNATYYPVLSTLPELGRLSLYLAGGILIIDGHISLGTFVVFASYVSLVNMAVENLAMRITSAAQVETTLSLYDELLERDPAPQGPEGGVDPGPAPEIELRRLSYGYEPGKPVLRDLDLRLPGGTWTAVLGPSAAGKTTLLRLLGGLVDIGKMEGHAAVGDVSLQEQPPQALWSHVNHEGDEPRLLPGSVRDNVAYARPDAGPEEIGRAIRAVAAEDLVERLPRGLDTLVGGDEVSLSLGERQQLALARALCARSRLVLLDGALDNLPAEGRPVAVPRLREACREATVLVATNDAELARGADRVVVIEDGRITAAGRPEELSGGAGFAGRLLARPGDKGR